MEEQDYTIKELIHNDSLWRIINGTASAKEINYWNRWVEASEANRQKMQQAMSAISGFRFAEPKDSDKQREWDRLYKKTINKTQKHAHVSSQVSSIPNWFFRAAAAVLLISVVGAGAYWQVFNWQDISSQTTEMPQLTTQKTISTDANEQKIVRFTNGDKEAKIVMNNNSTIVYDVGLLKNQSINVNLEGEAYFDVQKGFSDSPAFSVITPNGIIEDIGTEFMVTVGNRVSRVVLQEGLVHVRSIQEGNVMQELEVAKGEMIEFNSQDIVNKSKVNSTFYTSWATGYVEFEETKISEFAQFIENRYGTTVKIVDPELADLTIDGSAYFTSLEELIRSVSDVLEISVHQSSSRDTIFIGRDNGE